MIPKSSGRVRGRLFKKHVPQANRRPKMTRVISLEENINMDVLKQVKQLFEDVDVDGGGSLDMDEFVGAFCGEYPNSPYKVV